MGKNGEKIGENMWWADHINAGNVGWVSIIGNGGIDCILWKVEITSYRRSAVRPSNGTKLDVLNFTYLYNFDIAIVPKGFFIKKVEKLRQDTLNKFHEVASKIVNNKKI